MFKLVNLYGRHCGFTNGNNVWDKAAVKHSTKYSLHDHDSCTQQKIPTHCCPLERAETKTCVPLPLLVTKLL